MAQDSVPSTGPSTAALLAAYLAADYRVGTAAATLPLVVGRPAPAALARILPGPGWTLLTAWNPQSVALDDTANAAADAALQADLDRLGLRRLPATGGGVDGSWREEGWLVAGLPTPTADGLARRHGQAGILHWRHHEPVRLRMYRPRPAGRAPEWVDWAPL